MSLPILILLLRYSTCFGHLYLHLQEFASMLNYHIGCIVLGLLCVGVWVRFGWSGIRAAVSQDTTPAEPHPNSNTHSKPRTIRPMW